MLALKPRRSLFVWLLRLIEYSSLLPNWKGALLLTRKRNAILRACSRGSLPPYLLQDRITVMTDFHELVNRLRSPGDEEVPDTIFDDLTTTYDTAFEGWQGTVSEKEAAIERLNGEVSRLKSANYDLLTRVSTGTDPIDPNGSDDADEPPVTVNTLFKRK